MASSIKHRHLACLTLLQVSLGGSGHPQESHIWLESTRSKRTSLQPGVPKQSNGVCSYHHIAEQHWCAPCMLRCSTLNNKDSAFKMGHSWTYVYACDCFLD